MPALQLFPIPSAPRTQPFDLPAVVLENIQSAGVELHEGDMVIISSKYAAIAEGRVVDLNDITPGERARTLATQYRINPAFVELILRESDTVLGGIPYFLLAAKDYLIAPNAGLDQSNVPGGLVVLFPQDSFATAAQIHAIWRATLGVRVGVVIADSHIMPGRKGTSGVAVGVAGFAPLSEQGQALDFAGQAAAGSPLALADNLCAAAELLMGEADEGIPIVVIRGTGVPMTEAAYDWRALATDDSLTPYIRGLANLPEDVSGRNS